MKDEMRERSVQIWRKISRDPRFLVDYNTDVTLKITHIEDELIGLFAKELNQVRKEAFEKAAEIAENSFMDGVLPKAVSVRDHIAKAIREEMKKGKG